MTHSVIWLLTISNIYLTDTLQKKLTLPGSGTWSLYGDRAPRMPPKQSLWVPQNGFSRFVSWSWDNSHHSHSSTPVQSLQQSKNLHHNRIHNAQLPTIVVSPFWPVWHYASAVLVMAWCLLSKIGVLSKRIELVFGMKNPSAYLILGYLQNKGNSCKLWTLQISPQHVDHRDTSIHPIKMES